MNNRENEKKTQAIHFILVYLLLKAARPPHVVSYATESKFFSYHNTFCIEHFTKLV